MYYKDCKGKLIKKGDKIRYKKNEGIVVDERTFEKREGLYVILEDGIKVRIKDIHTQATIIQDKTGNKLNNRKNALQISRK